MSDFQAYDFRHTWREHTTHQNKWMVHFPHSGCSCSCCFILGTGCPSASSVSWWEVSFPYCDSGPSETYSAHCQKWALLGRHFGKSGDPTSMFLSTLTTIIFQFISYAALELTSLTLRDWSVRVFTLIIIIHSGLPSEECTFSGALDWPWRQTSLQHSEASSLAKRSRDRWQVLEFYESLLEAGVHTNLTKGSKGDAASVWYPSRRTEMFLCHCCDISEKQTQNTLRLNCPFVSWAFPLSGVLLYASSFCMLGFQATHVMWIPSPNTSKCGLAVRNSQKSVICFIQSQREMRLYYRHILRQGHFFLLHSLGIEPPGPRLCLLTLTYEHMVLAGSPGQV